MGEGGKRKLLGGDILKEPKRLFSYTNVTANNKLWNWSKFNKKPMVCIKKKRKYANIDYDMWTINYDLTEDAKEKLDKLRWEIIEASFKNGGKKSVTSSINKSTGFIGDIILQVAIDNFPKVKDLLFDESNWESISFAIQAFRPRPAEELP